MIATGWRTAALLCYLSLHATRISIGSWTMHKSRLEFGVASALSQGARQYQEDAIRVGYPDGTEAADGRRPVVLAVLSDGMGGHVSGEVASRLVCVVSMQHLLSIAVCSEL